MKVVQMIVSHGQGGLEKHFTDLCNGLSRKGHEVHAIFPSVGQFELDSAVQRHPFEFKGGRYNPWQAIRLFRLLRSIDPLIIHTHAGKASACMHWIRPFIRAKTVATVHGLKSRTAPYMASDAIIAVSQKARAMLPENDKTTIVYNGIQVAASSSSVSLSARFNNDWPTALSVGRLVTVKGFDLLIPAVKGLELNLVIVGDGPERVQLEQQVSEHELWDQVALLGSVENAAKLIPQSDLCVVSSRREGFSYFFAEALMSRVPVVSTLVNDSESLLEESNLVREISVKAIHKSLQSYLDSPEIFRAGCEKAFNWAEKSLTVDAMVESNEAVLCRVLSED